MAQALRPLTLATVRGWPETFAVCPLFVVALGLFAMFGRSKDYDELFRKIVSVEDLLMTNLPRLAASESRLDACDSRIGSLQAQMDMNTRRVRRLDETQDVSAPSQDPATHRGLGALPKPSAPPLRGFSQGQIAALATPPGSVVISADRPDITEETKSNQQHDNEDDMDDEDDDESTNPLDQCRADMAALEERLGDLHDFVNITVTKLDRAVVLLESLQVRVIANESKPTFEHDPVAGHLPLPVLACLCT